MAKKKTTHQDQTTQNGAKTHQSPPSIDDVSEKIESLKSLNSMLLKETFERRQQVDSLQQSNGSLEIELKKVEMEKNELKSDLGEMGECVLMGEIERDLMFVFVGVQVGEKFDVFERERCDFEKKIGGFERDLVRIVKEKSEIEEVKREREVEIGVLKKELSDVLRVIESERVASSRLVCERDGLRSELDGKIEEVRVVKLRLGEVEERERVVRDEAKVLSGKCDRLAEENEEKKRRLELVLNEKGLVEGRVVESNKVIEGLREKVVEMDREKEGVVIERDLQAVKISKLENDVIGLSDVVLSLRKKEEKLCGNVDVLEKKCCEGEAKEKELRMEIGKLVENLESLVKEKGLIKKDLDEALKQSDELMSRVEEISKAKSVVEGDKEKQEVEILELKMQVTNLKDTVRSLEEASRAEKEKIKGLESEVGQIVIERDEARKGLKQEKSHRKELMEKIAEKKKSIEESFKVTEKIKNQKSSLTEQKKELENRQSVLKKDLAMAEKKLAETQKELDSIQAKVGLADANSENILNLLRNTVTLVSKTKEENGIVNQVKAGEEVKAFVAELDMIKDAFKSLESAEEDMKRKLESVQQLSEAAQKKSFWTLLTSATIFAAVSVTYAAARH